MADRQDSSGASWTRAQWLDYADRLLDGARQWASPEHARITPPGAEGGYGRAVDGLEGFARTFLLAGFRIAGERGENVDDLIDFYLRGLRAGVDPDSSERWVRLDEHAQAKVEAASIALILDMTRPWVWDRLDETTRARLVDYLAPVVGDTTYPPTNWLWFRVVVQTFLRSVGGPWSAQDIADDLARHDGLRRAGGWIADGPERSFDHYVGWALHLYPVLWSRMRGADEIARQVSPGRAARDTALLDRYLTDAIALVGADGSPLIQGRSLIYRFAAAAPFWAGVLADVPSHTPGALRRAAERIVRHFADAGVPDDRGALTMGWHGEWRRLAQGYSGPGSPYWAVKGLIGISLPEEHPVWSAPAEPLPAEVRDTVRAIGAPGWLVSATAADGIVRVINHGTDHAAAGSPAGDSPLYARLGYSTAAAPLHDGQAWRQPLDQSVTLIDAHGRATHRAGMSLAGVRLDGDAAVAASTARAHWIDPAGRQLHHGSGIVGAAAAAGELYTASVVRGPWELRLVHVAALAAGIDPGALRLRVGGWPVADEDAPVGTADSDAATASTPALVSSVRSLIPAGEHRVVRRDGASPLGRCAAVPTVEFDVEIGAWYPILVTLAGADTAAAATLAAQAVQAQLSADGDLAVTWPDGASTAHVLIDPPIAQRATGSPQIGPAGADRNREGEVPV